MSVDFNRYRRGTMKTYIVAYDFHTSYFRKQWEDPSDTYKDLFKEIMECPHWLHHIGSVWLVKTNESADELYRRLEKYLDDNILLLIVEMGRDRQGWLPEMTWKWIQEHVGGRVEKGHINQIKEKEE